LWAGGHCGPGGAEAGGTAWKHAGVQEGLQENGGRIDQQVYGGESGPNNDTQVSQCKNDKIKERKKLHMEMEKEIVFLKKDVNEFLE
jgi:hypothetical protein